jgi:plastocyanin
MKRVLTLAVLAASTGVLGCSATSSPTVQTPPAAAQVAIEPSITVETAAEAEKATKPARVRYVVQEKKWGTLKAKFVLDGAAPAPKKVSGVQDPICAAFPLMTENMVVSKDGGIKNLVVQMLVDKQNPIKEIHPDLLKPKDGEVLLDNKDCTFIPHILVARVGQAVNVKNSDATGHNANFSLFANQGENFLVPANGNKVGKKFEKDEVAPMPIECNVHSWMKAYVIITSHPYVGVSNEDGVLEIPNLPVGKVTFKAWHESQDKFLDEASVDGKPQKWARARFELDIKEGVNDLGVIKINAKKFKN